MIKKYKNGTLLLAPDKSQYTNGILDENFYHDDMFMQDLYITEIGACQYLVDFNKNLVYRLGSYLMQNPLKELLETLEVGRKRRYLFPYSLGESQELITQLGKEVNDTYDHVHVE